MACRAVIGPWARRGLAGLFVAVLATGMAATPAFAARPSQPGNGGGSGGKGGSSGGGGGGGGTSTPTGNDVSYPQCGSSLPSSPAFAIVGVNDGLAGTLNPCLGPDPSYPQSQLYWAVSASIGGTKQPNASLYVNTADPGNVYNGTVIADWPTSDYLPGTQTLISNGTGSSCSTTTVTINGQSYTVGDLSSACAWQYGYNKAVQDAGWLTAAANGINGLESSVVVPNAAGNYSWWLDVETANTWQSGATGLAMNVADLQGMVAGLEASGVALPAGSTIPPIGVYSTSAQWNTITGTPSSVGLGSLYQLANWIPGARSLSGAESNCAQASFTRGTVTVTQWFAKPIDADYSCIG